MSKTMKIILSTGLVAVCVLVFLNVVLINRFSKGGDVPTGAAGNMLIEDYDPYVRYNAGIKTALPIETSDNMSAADVTATDDLTATDDAIITDNIGISTTSVTYDLNVGAQAATTSVSTGKLCWRAYSPSGSPFYIIVNSGAGTSPFSTSSVSCF